ncbi:MAG: hypothetical protein IPM29_11275 [Planctomycetes bacterium]|nr:hypothetical protein [Planctomycetota bacterium]
MIRINLLPDEYRRSERTSPKLFAAVIGSVMAVCCSFGWFGFVYFGELGKLEVRHSEVKERLTGMTPRIKQHDALQKEKAHYAQLATTIEQISRERILWSRFLDQVVDVVNGDGDPEGPRAWLKSLRVDDGRDAKNGPRIQMPGSVQGAEMRRVADFFDHISAAPFAEHVVNDLFPGGKVATDLERKPETSLGFALELVLEPAAKWHDRSSAPAPTPAPSRKR